jgi:hypothetical protein
MPASTGPVLTATRKRGQSGCSDADRLGAPLQLERGADGDERVVGLVAALVEDGEDLVADEVLHLALERVGDHRRQLAEVGHHHRVHGLGPARLRERREAREVGEQDADVAVAGQRLVQVEGAEALLVPLRVRGGGDRGEADRHQRVPLPPAQPPARGKAHDGHDQRLGEQRERERHGERELRTPARPHPVVGDGRVAVRGHAEQREDGQRQRDVLRADAVLERRELGHRHGGPGGDHAEHEPGQRARVADDAQRGVEPVLHRRGRRPEAGHDKPDGRGQHEAGVRAAHELPRRGERVEPEEAGAREEREPDQQQPRVPPAPPGLRDGQRERGVEHAGRQHDPEVRRPVLPALVHGRRGAQEDHQRQRQREREGGRCQTAGERAHAAIIADQVPGIVPWMPKET